jgi:hypothetical protein
MPAENYLDLVIREMQRTKNMADRAIAQLPPGGLFVRLAPGDNSIATIIKHLSGNMLSRWKDFLTTDGEKPGRNRDEEFVHLPGDTDATILARWELGWAMLFTALGQLTEADLGRTVTIRGESLTALQALNRQFTHYPYHAGQIIFIAKHLAGPNWQSLTIPVGGSAAFNQAPRKYLPDPKA